jgi:hypothetical protein
MSGDATFLYNTNLANYKGIAPGQLVVDAGTLITLAKADLSGTQLDLLFRSGRDVVITSTIKDEATSQDFPDATTITNWINRNHNNPHLIIDESPLNPAFVPRSDNGERSIIGYIQRTGGDIRVVTEDIEWMNGDVPGVAAARDLAGTSGVNLTTNEFVNDLMLSGAIAPYEHTLAAVQILQANRNSVEQKNLLFRPGDDIQIADQDGNTGHVLYFGPLGAIALDEHGVPIGVPAVFGLHLNIPKVSPLKFTEADHSDDTAALAYGPVENVNGKFIVVGDATDHSSLLQQARFEYDPDAGTMTRSLVKDDGTSTKTVFDTGTEPWSSDTSAFDAYQRLQSQRVVFDGGNQQIKEFDPNNTHPYGELDIDEDATGKITAAKPKIDGQPNNGNNVDYSAVGQVLGSALGRALAPNNQFVQLAASTVVGAIGQKLAQTFAASLKTDGAGFDFATEFSTDFNASIAGAGASSVASFLVAEIGTALHLDGFGQQLFDAAGGGFAGSVASQIATKMAHDSVSFAVAVGEINFASAAASAAYGISSLLGSYLGHELVPAQTHEGAVGGQLLGAIGSAIGISAAIGQLLGSVLDFLLPGVGSLIGTVLGTLIGDAFGSHPHPAAVDLLDQAGDHYGYGHSSSSDGGGYDIADQMAAATAGIVNGYLAAVKGIVIDHSKQTMVGYVSDPDFRYVDGWTPNHHYYSFISPDDAVHAAALDILQHTEVIGGDLLMKRAHQNSPSNVAGPEPEWAGITTPSSQSGAEQLLIMSADLSVAQDYENYLNNREAINALIAANPDSAFAAGWIATFARVNDLGLNHMGASDFLGGLVGYLDSVSKAGLGAEAANATVRRGSDNSIIVEVKVANGVEVPGSLSAFADHVNITSDAGGQTVQFTVDSGMGASGYHLLGPGASGGDGANDLWIGTANAGSTFTGTGGHDILVGGTGNDVIVGGSGFDFIDGGAGSDYLFGQDGNDILRGGPGIDFLFGGAGDDTYVFNRGDGVDSVLDDVTTTTTTSYWHDWYEDQGGNNILHHDWVTTTTTSHPDAGRDTLAFGPGIARSDIVVQRTGNDLIVGVKDPAHPGAQPTDWITLQNWADAKDRIENFVFADGATLDLSGGDASLAAFLVPFGESLSHSTVAENAAIGTAVGTVAGFDFAGANLTYSLASDPSGCFSINASTGEITVASALNFEGTPAWPLTVRVADQSGHVFDKAFTINVTDVNEAPSNATLSGGSVAENSANGTLVGTVTGSDPDAGASLHYALTDDAGGRFAINPATGAITVANGTLLDYETAHSHQITVRTIDQGGLALDKNFTIAVSDVFERIHADFNGDGKSDVLWRSDSGAIAAWNSGTPAGGHVIADPGVPASWHVAGLGDFDGNGKADILWQNDDGAAAVWDNGTPGHLIADASAVAGWHVAGAGDFDGNRHDDILWRNDNGAVAVWNDGAAAGGHVVGDPVAASWHVAGVGDFDGNGRDDILWQNDDGAVALWDNGTPGHLIADPGAVAGWHFAGAGDFDGNHHDDILWRNDSGAVAVWNNGAAAGGHVIADSMATSWHIAEVGDFDGNGKADILWRNDDGGVAVWDNGTPAGGHIVADAGQTASNWHIV